MTAPTTFTVTKKVNFAGAHNARRSRPPDEAQPAPAAPAGRVPRISRLMALAIRFEQLLREGVVNNHAEIAMLGHVTRARVTQIMNLLHLAPDLQEALLFLPPITSGRAMVHERDIRPIVAEVEWETQRRLWARRQRLSTPTPPMPLSATR